MLMPPRSLAAVLFALIAIVFTAGAASADVITVDFVGDAAAPDTADGRCTFREAIDVANSGTATIDCVPAAQGGIDEIRFAIAPQDTTVKTINVAAALPAVSAPVLIDGWPQRGVAGYTGPPLIELNGSGVGPNGLRLDAGGAGSTIRGLVINRFSQRGISINAANVTVVGSYIGINAAGTAAGSPQQIDGISISQGTNILIGGTGAGQRNVISGQSASGVYISGGIPFTGTRIIGNFIGTNATGTAAVGNGDDGVGTDEALGLAIGGSGPGEGNLISGNGENGIEAAHMDGSTIQGNLIGTDVAGTAAIPNGRHGIEVIFTQNLLIGGTAAGAGNLIARNATDGISVADSAFNTVDIAIVRNRIFENGGLGIDLQRFDGTGDGVTNNDGGDVDTTGGSGVGNNGQNFPVVTSATTGRRRPSTAASTAWAARSGSSSLVTRPATARTAKVLPFWAQPL
jgi:hypothetical protein